MNINVDTKFNIGDTAYIINLNENRQKSRIEKHTVEKIRIEIDKNGIIYPEYLLSGKPFNWFIEHIEDEVSTLSDMYKTREEVKKAKKNLGI